MEEDQRAEFRGGWITVLDFPPFSKNNILLLQLLICGGLLEEEVHCGDDR